MICEYGCNKEAQFVLKNGKNCCSKHPSKCEAIKAKNALGVSKMHKEGRGHKITNEQRKNAHKTIIKNNAPIALCENSTSSNSTIKRYLLDVMKYEYKCSICGIDTWQGESIKLELDHIDGNNKNNLIKNLRLLCPNCHSQTDNFRGKNKNSGILKVSDEQILDALSKTKNTHQALLLLGLAPKGGNYNRVERIKILNKF